MLIKQVDLSVLRHCDHLGMLPRSMQNLFLLFFLSVVNSAFHPSRVGKLSNSLSSWGYGGVSCVGCQVTLCDPVWQVTPCSCDVGFH